MNRFALIVFLPLAWAGSAAAQPMAHDMPGMNMPAPEAKPPAKAKAPTAKPAAKPRARSTKPSAKPPAAADPHAGHNMPAPPSAGPQPAAPQSQPPAADPHAGHAMPGMAADRAAIEVPRTPPPPPPKDYAADRFFDGIAMDAARRELRVAHGGETISLFILDQAEYRSQRGSGGYAWDGEFWYGGDINRLVLKSEGEGTRGEGLEKAELQALYSRAIGPYFNLQAGVRHDFKPKPSRTFATVGVEGLAPYWLKVESALFLSNEGELLARAEGYYDLRLTQRLILQPNAEINLSAQDSREIGVGSGVSDLELGLRLRYEINREFAPYIGVVWERKFGKTADFARAEGERAESTSLVVGVRTFF
jgi:copper resistance protein B